MAFNIFEKIIGTKEDPTQGLMYKTLSRFGTQADNATEALKDTTKMYEQKAQGISQWASGVANKPGYVKLGQMVKSKYPEYNDMSDEELGQKMLAKYPEYKDIVSGQTTTLGYGAKALGGIGSMAVSAPGMVTGGAEQLGTGMGKVASAQTKQDVIEGYLQQAKGATTAGFGVATGAMPVASTVFGGASGFEPVQKGLGYVAGKAGDISAGTAGFLGGNQGVQEQARGLGEIALPAVALKGVSMGGKYVKPASIATGKALVRGAEAVAPKISSQISDLRNNIAIKNAKKAQALTDEGLKEIYEAVNPTTRENKAVLRQRVEDLLPYIDENKKFGNDLETVKGRVDADKATAFKSMEDFETNIGVKGKVDTDSVAKAIANKYQEKIGDSFINADEARMAQQLIDTLKGFGKTVDDANIIKIRRAWDKIIEKNKGFMQSAEATSKGDIFADANRFFREEIKRSNPEYAKYLEKAHKTITISDILDATIQRRTGQTQGGFLRKASENTARVIGTGLGTVVGGIPGAFVGAGATEALLAGVNKLTGSSSKLTKGKKLILKNQKNGTSTSNIRNSRTPSVVAEPKQLTSGPRLKTPASKLLKPSNESKVNKPTTGDTIPEGYTKNAFGEIIKKPSNKTGGFIKIAPEPKKLSNPLVEEARKYRNVEEFKALGFEKILEDLRGVKNNSIVEIPIKDIKIVWKQDLENAKEFAKKTYNINEAPPVEFTYDIKTGKYILEDGHHRYISALRNKSNLKGKIDGIKGNMEELANLYEKEKGVSIKQIYEQSSSKPLRK